MSYIHASKSARLGSPERPDVISASSESESTRLLREISLLDEELGVVVTNLLRQLEPLLPIGFFDPVPCAAQSESAEALPKTELGRRLYGLSEYRRNLIERIREVSASLDVPTGPF